MDNLFDLDDFEEIQVENTKLQQASPEYKAINEEQ